MQINRRHRNGAESYAQGNFGSVNIIQVPYGSKVTTYKGTQFEETVTVTDDCAALDRNRIYVTPFAYDRLKAELALKSAA